MGKVKVGFAGTGFMGQVAHLMNYAVLSDICEVVAISEPRRQLGQSVAARYGVPDVYANHEEMLKNAELDAVVCSQSYANHKSLVPDILKAGKALFTEKPIAVSPETGTQLADIADEAGVLYMVGYHKRSDPAMEYARDLIDEWKTTGEYGKLRFIRATMPPGDWTAGGQSWFIGSSEPYPPMSSEGLPDYFSPEIGNEYNAFVNYYIHQVNALRFLLGEPYKVTYAEPSGAVMAIESASGVAGVLEMAPYSTTIDWQESYLVGFEQGYVMVELPAPLASLKPGRVSVYRDGKAVNGVPMQESPSLPMVHAMRNQAKNFILAVKGEKPAPCLAREAVEDLLIAVNYVRMRYGA